MISFQMDDAIRRKLNRAHGMEAEMSASMREEIWLHLKLLLIRASTLRYKNWQMMGFGLECKRTNGGGVTQVQYMYISLYVCFCLSLQV